MGTTVTPLLERRRAPRRLPQPNEPISRLRLRVGREVTVIDVSAVGALVEGGARLLPGTHVDVHVLSASGRILMRSRIVRAFVSEVTSDRIAYRGAIAFERPVDVGGYSVPGVAGAVDVAWGKSYPLELA